MLSRPRTSYRIAVAPVGSMPVWGAKNLPGIPTGTRPDFSPEHEGTRYAARHSIRYHQHTLLGYICPRADRLPCLSIFPAGSRTSFHHASVACALARLVVDERGSMASVILSETFYIAIGVSCTFAVWTGEPCTPVPPTATLLPSAIPTPNQAATQCADITRAFRHAVLTLSGNSHPPLRQVRRRPMAAMSACNYKEVKTREKPKLSIPT